MKEMIHLKKINANIFLNISNKNTIITLDIKKLSKKILYFEFIEKDYINVFFLIIKIDEQKILIEKEPIIDFDGQIIYNDQIFIFERFKKLYEIHKYNNIVEVSIDNLLFSGDIGNSELLINVYLLEETEDDIKLIDSRILKNVNSVNIQDYYFNNNKQY